VRKSRVVLALVVVTVMILAFLLVASGSTAVGQAAELHLVNPDFEGEFTQREAPEVRVASGWDYSYLNSDRECPSPCSRPEFTPETTIVVQGHSQRWFSTYAHQFAAIHQLVDVEAGQYYKFSCSVYAISEPMGQMGAFVGINPWHNGPFHRTMVWGKEQVGEKGWIYREWTRVSVTAQAYSDRILVAMGGNNAYATKNNAVYWDNCTIEQVSGGTQPTPTPYPTYTPYPTPTPGDCPTVVPGEGCDYDTIRGIMREELDKTRWGSVP